MLKETRNLYERLGKKAKLPARALEILHASNCRTPYKGLPYTMGSVYAILCGRYEDRQVDNAIMEAAREYIEKQRELTDDIKVAVTELA